MKLARGMMIKAALLATLALPMLTMPAFGQQEVDPTWYNPWPNANKTGVQPPQAKPTPHKNDKSSPKVKAEAAAQPKKLKQAHAQEPAHTAEAQPPQAAN